MTSENERHRGWNLPSLLMIVQHSGNNMDRGIPTITLGRCTSPIVSKFYSTGLWPGFSVQSDKLQLESIDHIGYRHRANDQVMMMVKSTVPLGKLTMQFDMIRAGLMLLGLQFLGTISGKPIEGSSQDGSLQTFTGALGNIPAPKVVKNGDKFDVLKAKGGKATLNDMKGAIVRSCDVQFNACADAFNLNKTPGTSLEACGKQKTDCLATVDESVKKAGNTGSESNTKKTDNPSNPTNNLAANNTTPSPSTTPPATQSTEGNLQTFTGALGGIPPPKVVKGEKKFDVIKADGSKATLGTLKNALVRSCDVQFNKCADAFNLKKTPGTSLDACGKQKTECIASTDESVKKAGDLSSSSTTKSTETANKTTTSVPANNTKNTLEGTLQLLASTTSPTDNPTPATNITTTPTNTTTPATNTTTPPVKDTSPPATNTTTPPANTTTTPESQTGEGNFQTFTGALGNIPAPKVVKNGDKFDVLKAKGGKATLNQLKSAIVRSCDVQFNACADAFNLNKTPGTSLEACGKQKTDCLATVDESVKKAGNTGSESNNKKTDNPSNPTSNPAANNTTPSPSTTPPATQSTEGNLQTFTGALGGIPPPKVVKGEKKFDVIKADGSKATLGTLKNALVRSCDVQFNKCADAFNLKKTPGTSLDACGKQKTECIASTDESVKKAGDLSSSSTTKSTGTANNTTTTPPANNTKSTLEGTLQLLASTTSPTDNPTPATNITTPPTNTTTPATNTTTPPVENNSTPATNTTTPPANTTTTPDSQTGEGNFQTFTGALGNIPAPKVVKNGDKFDVLKAKGGKATLNQLKSAIVRSCDVQFNACADAFNLNKTPGTSLEACGKQKTECLATVDESVKKAGNTGSESNTKKTDNPSNPTSNPAANNTTPSPSTTPPATQSTEGNLQTFTGALGGIPPPKVVKGEKKFDVIKADGSKATLGTLKNALVRSCDVQFNKCADAFNLKKTPGTSLDACGKQKTECIASTDESVKKAGDVKA
ncbi:hypothetical protein DFH28DRAFT_1169172 [Melampsora americana]|nr:hypothetical protein DFH28DRAFT_1169172 [Melampsora americana]